MSEHLINEFDENQSQLQEKFKTLNLEQKESPNEVLISESYNNSEDLNKLKTDITMSSSSDISGEPSLSTSSICSSPEYFSSSDSSMYSIPHSEQSIEDLEMDMSLESLQLSPESEEKILTLDIQSSDESDDNILEPFNYHLNDDPISYTFKESELRQIIISPHFELKDFVTKCCQQNRNNSLKKPKKSSDMKFAEKMNNLSQTSKNCRQTICGYYICDDPNEKMDGTDRFDVPNQTLKEESQEKQNNKEMKETERHFMTTEERNHFYENCPVISESTRSEEFQKFMDQIYSEMSSEKKEKIVSDLNSTDSQRSKAPEEQDIENLINAVYYDYTSGQKKEIFEGLKEPKSGREQNKDVDNIEELIDKIYSGYSLSRSIESTRSGKTFEEPKSPSEPLFDYAKLGKLVGTNLFGSSTQNKVKEQISETESSSIKTSQQTTDLNQTTEKTSASESNTELIEGKWKPAQDSVEPRPAKRSPYWRTARHKYQQNFRSKEFDGK